MLQSINWRSLSLATMAGATLWLTGCNRPESVQPTTTSTTTTSGTTSTTNVDVNTWILTNMQNYYYWNTQIPTNPDKTKSPADFFSSLLYKYDATLRPDGDRFSWIQESAAELTASLSGAKKTSGMEFQLYIRPNTTDDVVGSVLYVLPGSPAAKAGIKRGDIFHQVDGQKLTRSNYRSLLFGTNDTRTYGFLTVQNSALVEVSGTKTVTSVVFQEDPVYMDSVYTIGSKKIGYLVYNQFIPGPNGSSVATYDQKVDAIFAKFKQQGVNELVLDLRYNPGGYVSSSLQLASLMAKNVTNSSVYYKQDWNAILTQQYNAQYGANWNVQNFVTKANNIGANLSRVYILTTGRTASASEMIINGLRPFMTVNTIGTTTVGKNVGSVTISDKTGKIKWGMQPIVFKSQNAAGLSDYTAGFVPTVEVREPLNPKQLGDLSEALLNETIFQITGSRTARRAVTAEVSSPTIVGSSIEQKAGGSNMFIQMPK